MMSLWRGLALILLILAVLVPILVWQGVSQQAETLRTVVSERDEQTARLTAATISEAVDERSRLVRAIAEQAAVSDDLDLLLGNLIGVEQSFEGGVAIFTLDGVPVAWRGVLRDETISWSSPASAVAPRQFVNAANQRFTLVTATNERVQVVGAFDPVPIIETAVNDILGEGGEVLVVNSVGQVISGSEGRLTAAERVGAARALAGQSDVIAPTSDSANSGVAIAYSPIESAEWGLVTEVESIIETNVDVLRIGSLFLIPVLLVAFGALWFGDMRIVRPLEQLASQAGDLGRGQYSSIKTPVGGIEPIRALQAELVSMSNDVQEAESGLMSQMAAVTQGQEEERRRLARELHDDTIQSLIALNQRVLLAKMKANGAMTAEFAEMEGLLAEMIGDVRRFTHALRPIGLEELGLIPAIELMAESHQRDGFEVMVLERGEARRLPMAHEFALYRIAQEAVQNVTKHAGAEQVVISLAYEGKRTVLRVEDDGEGFVVPSSLAEMARQGSYGLLGIYERAELIGAEVGISSDKNGTRLELVMTNE